MSTRQIPTKKDVAVTAEPASESANGVDVEFKIIDVDARTAAYWLERNAENNRREKVAKIAKYARDMATGRWLVTGDTVKITPDGVMVDGGQRMRAVLRANSEYADFKSVRMVFAHGVPVETMHVTDTGAGRNFSDILMIEEAVNRTQVGPIVRRVCVWDQGNYIYQRGSSSVYTDPTMTELLDLYRSDPQGFDASAARAVDLRLAKIGNGTAGGTAHYVLTRLDYDQAQTFFDGVVGGANLGDRDPILVLRNRLIRASANTRVDRADFLSPTEQLYFYIRAWNGWRRDEAMDKLQLPNARDVTNQNFPQPV